MWNGERFQHSIKKKARVLSLANFAYICVWLLLMGRKDCHHMCMVAFDGEKRLPYVI
jgi:hypothetical protein